MEGFKSHAADKRLAEELGRIGVAILTDHSSYPDIPIPTASANRTKTRQDTRSHHLLIPRRCSFHSVSRGVASFVKSRGAVVGHGIGGVFRALFAQMDDQDVEADSHSGGR